MMLGLIDKQITTVQVPKSTRYERAPSHGDYSLEVLQKAYEEMSRTELHFDQLGMVNLPGQKDVLYHLVQGVDKLIEQGVRVICLPMGFSKASPLLETIARVCVEKDILLIAPSGNKGADTLMFPAAYSSVLAVGAADPTGEPAAYSGSRFDEHGNCAKPEVLADGMHVSVSDNQFSRVTVGTSVACARVAGWAAAILNERPALSSAELKNLLCGSCTPTAGSRFGLLNDWKAMRLANPLQLQSTDLQMPDECLEKGWVDARLKNQCLQAAKLKRTTEGLLATTSPESLTRMLRIEPGSGLKSSTQLAHFNVVHVEAEPAFLERLFTHPDLTWASAVDVNYFDL